jgi:hypothetical protein
MTTATWSTPRSKGQDHDPSGTQIVHLVEYNVLHPAQPLSRQLELLIQRTITKTVRLNLFGAKALIECEFNKDQHPKHHYVNFLPA